MIYMHMNEWKNNYQKIKLDVEHKYAGIPLCPIEVADMSCMSIDTMRMMRIYSDEEFAKACYENLLCRSGTSDEVRALTIALSEGQRTREDVIRHFMYQNEARPKGQDK